MDGGSGVAEGGIGDELSVQLEGVACSHMFYKEEGEKRQGGEEKPYSSWHPS